MLIKELHSMRNKTIYPDVYNFEAPSEKLRRQLVFIFGDSIGKQSYLADGFGTQDSASQLIYKNVFDILIREYGSLPSCKHFSGCYEAVESLILNSELDLFLDTLELLCSELEGIKYSVHKQRSDAKQSPEEALQLINERMKRDGFGYEFTGGQLIRVDNQFIHSEVVKPALHLLQDFENVQSEFLKAHEHYRNGRLSEAIVSCNLAFEGLMKEICAQRGWGHKPTVTAGGLITVCLENGLYPSGLQEQLTALDKVLVSGVPHLRNNQAHAQVGEDKTEVTDHLARYALHLTASNLVFLAECNKAL